jgi:cysteine synthase A
VVVTDVVDRDPIPQWTDGRVTLLGDAAHPMSPALGQGASIALEDAVVLAACLRSGDIPAGLAAYSAARAPRAAAAVRQSRQSRTVVVRSETANAAQFAGLYAWRPDHDHRPTMREGTMTPGLPTAPQGTVTQPSHNQPANRAIRRNATTAVKPRRGGIVSSVEDLIGDTPLLRLSFPDVAPSVRLLAKLEMFNPLSSVKDRPALHMIRAAELSGDLYDGVTVVEATSGNTGISVAALCAARGYRCVLVMPDNATEERRRILRAFGAELVLTPHQEGLVGTMARAAEVARSIPGSFYVGQDHNPNNPAAHYATTGPEIWTACDSVVDVFVCGVGTGGTMTGVARYLKERTDVHVVAIEPAGSPVMSGGERGPHRIPGIGGGIVQANTDLDCVDEVLLVSDVDAAAATVELARNFGLFVGVSSGAAAHAARVVARRPQWAGATIVTILPDTGERYLSIWDTLGATEAEEERAA